ncbi:phage tail protein, partial [Shigella sonnei]|nr:phage tail protein [Shigella sonnei]
MADYKLSELNSIDTIRSDDLLHVRVKKRPEMLGDEDRRMTYQDFLASFKLERFVQIAGSTMTGDLGIVKLLYGGKAVFDPTGSSEINIGDVLKTFKINSNGLKLTIADASRSATVYHTLNKPSPNELGMRTNEENDARYSRLAANNTFRGTQAILSDNEALIVKNITQGAPLYLRGQDADGSNRWYLGNDNSGTNNLVLKNVKSDVSIAILENLVTVNRTLQIAGQVQPSSFANLDARYFTQTAANQRFAQLAGNNTFSGINNFAGEFKITRDNSALVIKNASNATGLYLLGVKADGTSKFYLGTDTSDSVVNLHNYSTSTTISLSDVISATKTVRITGQVQPSDWTNIDSRYIPAGTLSNLAKLSNMNVFRSTQVITQDDLSLQLRNTVQDNALYFAGYNADNVRRWFIGNGERGNPSKLFIHNDKTGTTLFMQDDFFLNKTVRINGRVQPSDWSNIDDRYYNKTSADNRYLRVRSTGFNQNAGGKWAKIATVSMPQGTATAVIELFGGSGFNFGSIDQACKTEIVLRTGNGNPKGLNVVAWKNSPNGVVDQVGYVNTSGDNYDIYCNVGGYQNATTARVQSSDNATVQLFATPETSDSSPSGYVAGTIAHYYTSILKPSPSDIGAYTKGETDQKIAQAISDSTDLNKIYPVGIVTWFN